MAVDCGTAIGLSLGRKLGAGLVAGGLFAQILALSAGRPYFNADWVVIGGTGNVRSIVDHKGYAVDGHVLDQPDTAKQCTAPAAHADFANRLQIPFTGVEWYVSTRAASQWRWLHDFTGMHLVLVFASTVNEANYYLSTAGASHGIWVLGGGTSNQGTRVAIKSSGANNINIIANGTAPASTPTYLQVAQDQATSPQAALYAKGASVGTSAISGSIHTGDPDSPLVLGRRADTIGNKSFRFRELACAPTVGGGGRALYEQYISQAFGIAA